MINRWLERHPVELARFGQPWFNVYRHPGRNVRELMRNGYVTARVKDALFGYVELLKVRVNVGFIQGATLRDLARLVEDSGKLMRHVKLRPEKPVDEAALRTLIESAYSDIVSKLANHQ